MWKCILLGVALFAIAALIGLADEGSMVARLILVSIGAVTCVGLAALVVWECVQEWPRVLDSVAEAGAFVLVIAVLLVPILLGAYVGQHSRPLYGWLVGVCPFAIGAAAICCSERRKYAAPKGTSSGMDYSA
jgi:NADH:ubiquinone oxidoreductase subunit 6 (subunit J)